MSYEMRCKGKGEWSTYDVVCVDGTVKLAINGKFVNGVSRAGVRKGYLCLESEGSEIHFRTSASSNCPVGWRPRSKPRRSSEIRARHLPSSAHSHVCSTGNHPPGRAPGNLTSPSQSARGRRARLRGSSVASRDARCGDCKAKKEARHAIVNSTADHAHGWIGNSRYSPCASRRKSSS